MFSKIQHLSIANQKAIVSRVKRLAKLVNLNNPLEVEKCIYGLKVSNNYRNKLFLAYQYYCDANGIAYKKPRNQKVKPYVIHVPTEERINKIIACCGWVYSVVYSLSKYGLRPQEIANLTLKNLDLENGLLTVPSSKLGNQRTLKLDSKTVAMLKDYIHRKRISNINQKLFASARKIKEKWRFYRKRAYEKFKDVELLKIRLYDLRHWFATTTYMKTRDIFHVKYVLGHRNINNTMIYIHLANSLSNFSDEYHVRVARNLQEACSLIEQGFEYVTEMDGAKIFRKRK
ncbi:MAG: site-specific integrase [Candidatus Bathyarchaeia archaeon]